MAKAKWPKVTVGTHLTVTEYEDGRTELVWDDEQLLKEVREAIKSVKKTKSAKKTEWNDWYLRILTKDLRCGISETTVNKVVKKINPNYLIPVFECQLAHDSANHESKVCGKKLIEVKLDGVRVLTIVYPDGRVNQYSRNGKELVNFGHIKSQFEQIATGLLEPWVFDGEIMSSSFQDLMKQVHRKSDVAADDAVLNLFDCIPLVHFKAGKWNAKQSFRTEHVTKFVEHHKDVLTHVRALSQELVDLDSEKGQKRFKEINAQAIAGGYEGIMIKDPDAGYQCKRSVAWLKLKPFIEVSLTVTAVKKVQARMLVSWVHLFVRV